VADAGLCVFHADKHAGSFGVNLRTGAYKCHACGAGGGDIISFVRQRYNLDFIGAINYLRERY